MIVIPQKGKTVSFRDYFSLRAADYARFRPIYPDGLYSRLVSLVSAAHRALDCATGSGQAAVALAEHFDHVLAIDGSRSQLARAERHERVTYAVAFAEHAPARDHDFDLVTVAAAAHWFDLDRFYKEVRRVARPGGLLAMWSYYKFESEPAIDAVLEHYANRVVGSHWPERMHFNQEGYTSLPFPFERIPMPPFHAEAHWTLQEVRGYMATWSASQRYQEVHGREPIDEVASDLERLWGRDRRVRLRWPLHMLVGRVPE